MPMDKDKHEEILQELMNPEIESSRKTELLQELRTDHGTARSEVEDLTNTNEKLQHNNDDLVVSNSKLFRQLGITGDSQKEHEEEQKDFSESVTLEDLEKQS